VLLLQWHLRCLCCLRYAGFWSLFWTYVIGL
jgi:hypothetical protein